MSREKLALFFCIKNNERSCQECLLDRLGECIFEAEGVNAMGRGEAYFQGTYPRSGVSGDPPRPPAISILDRRIGSNIRRIREARGYTQGELARRLGTEQGRVSDIELGKRRVSISFIENVCAALGCDALELFLTLPYTQKRLDRV